MPNIITAMFDDSTAANVAVQRLVQQLGISRDHITIHAAEAGSAKAENVATTATSEEGGFWSSLKDLFVPEEDRLAYAEGIRRGSVVVSAQVGEHQMDEAMDVLEANGAIDLDTREAEWRSAGWTGGAAAADMGVQAISATGSEALPIVEERLVIGKRNVERGRVRVRSYVVETPVEEQVTLRHEHVDVQRRVVDRPVTDADRLFQERTIEATETSEEAVVAKEARVVEEVVVRKDADQRTETVRDTVRRTEIEVDDSTGKALGSGADTTQSSPSGVTKPQPRS